MSNQTFLKIPTSFLLNSDDDTHFNIYIERNDVNCVLYAKPYNFTAKHQEILKCNNIEYLYIDNSEQMSYEEYAEINLPKVIQNTKVPNDEKVKIIREHTHNITSKIFKQTHDEYLTDALQKQIINLVGYIVDFLITNDNSYESFQKLISTNYREYIHGLNVSVYGMSLLMAYYNSKNQKLPYKSELKHIGASMILHDIGKLKVPNGILYKEARLTRNEFEEIKKHPVYGLELCQQMNLDNTIINTVFLHHERLDGSGYPTQTTNISLTSQITGIVDMFDAMTSDRPHRKRKFTTFEALKTLKHDADKNKIDKQLLKLFIELVSSNQFSL